jgi:hypothetical protein
MSLEERELQINPIVTDSVQHNARVNLSFPTCVLDQPTNHHLDRLKHPQPNRVPLRRRRRHAGPRVLPRLCVLPRRHAPRLGADFLAEDRGQTEGFLLQTFWGYVGRRAD